MLNFTVDKGFETHTPAERDRKEDGAGGVHEKVMVGTVEDGEEAEGGG